MITALKASGFPFGRAHVNVTIAKRCIGAEGTGKHDLSLAILSQPIQFSMKIRTACNLPLPEENAAIRPRIDFICFLINMTDRDSIQVVENALTMVDIKYFLGRACLVVTGVHSRKKMTDIEQVTTMAEAYQLPVLYGEIKAEKEKGQLARRILNMVEIAAGFKRISSASLIETSRFYSKAT